MKLLVTSSLTEPKSSTKSTIIDKTITNTLSSAMPMSVSKRAIQNDHIALFDQQNSNREINRLSGFLSGHHLVYIVCGSLLAVAAITAAIVAYVVVKKRRRVLKQSEPPKRQQILKDNPKFQLHLATAQPPGPVAPEIGIQTQIMPPTSCVKNNGGTMKNSYRKFPSGQYLDSPATPTEFLMANPPRMKPKLLERRGSTMSLTIDVNPNIVETFQLPTPAKEFSAVEYLSSAANRMTRRQLRMCLTKALQEEFLDIPLNHSKKLDLPGCSNKNRYKSIWPNEHTRVLLPRRNSIRSPADRSNFQVQSQQTNAENNFGLYAGDNGKNPTLVELQTAEDESSTYINANYIRDLNSDTKVYIAAQGPMANTIDDFWSMVWNENCPCIVMMTRLKENNRVKCEQYLPSPDAQYGDIRVTVKATTLKNGYCVRNLILECGNEIRQIKHFWFQSWPDHKAPSSTAKQLIELVHEVESERQRQWRQPEQHDVAPLDGPVLVHCSAGLGRTGCFLATSMGMKQLRDENAVDILGIVCHLRMDRGGMIQTVEQYEFIHHALIQYERQLPESPASSLPPPTPLTSNGSNSNLNDRISNRH